MHDKKISVIVPVYNVEEYLKECVESLISQTWDNYEIILVDDGSTDEYSYAAEPPVQFRLSHLSRRSEPL